MSFALYSCYDILYKYHNFLLFLQVIKSPTLHVNMPGTTLVKIMKVRGMMGLISKVLSLFEQQRLEINNLSFGQFNVVLLRSPTTFVLLIFIYLFLIVHLGP